MDVYRPEFVEALNLLGKVCMELVADGYPHPILVGGAVVEFLVGSSIASGDFDLICEVPAQLREVLIRNGFEPMMANPSSALIHRGTGMAVEVVSGPLFDGRSDRRRLMLVSVGAGTIQVPPVEDMIADRMGQDASAPRGVPAMREQAIALYKVAENLDLSYLDRRIQEESVSTHSLQTLVEWAHDEDFSRSIC